MLLQSKVRDAADEAAAQDIKPAGRTTILNRTRPAGLFPRRRHLMIDTFIVNAMAAEFLADVSVVETLDGVLNAANR